MTQRQKKPRLCNSLKPLFSLSSLPPSPNTLSLSASLSASLPLSLCFSLSLSLSLLLSLSLSLSVSLTDARRRSLASCYLRSSPKPPERNEREGYKDKYNQSKSERERKRVGRSTSPLDPCRAAGVLRSRSQSGTLSWTYLGRVQLCDRPPSSSRSRGAPSFAIVHPNPPLPSKKGWILRRQRLSVLAEKGELFMDD